MGRKKKVVEQTVPVEPQHTQEELALMARHPGRAIQPGSLTPPPGKRSVVILCPSCGQTRQVYLADLHQVKLCPSCTVKARKEAARARRQARKETQQ